MARSGFKVRIEVEAWWSDQDFESEEEFREMRERLEDYTKVEVHDLIAGTWEKTDDLLMGADIKFKLVHDPFNS